MASQAMEERGVFPCCTETRAGRHAAGGVTGSVREHRPAIAPTRKGAQHECSRRMLAMEKTWRSCRRERSRSLPRCTQDASRRFLFADKNDPEKTSQQKRFQKLRACPAVFVAASAGSGTPPGLQNHIFSLSLLYYYTIRKKEKVNLSKKVNKINKLRRLIF